MLKEKNEKFYSDEALRNLIKDFDSETLGQFLPYISYDEENEIFINKSSVGFVLKCTPLLGANIDLEEQLTSLFKTTLPVGTNIQFLLLANSKIQDKLDYWQQARNGSGKIFELIARKRSEFFQRHAKNSNPPIRNFTLLISVSIEGADLSPMRAEEIRDLRRQISTAFNQVNLYHSNVKVEEFISILSDWINPSDSLLKDKLDWNKLDPINKQIIDFNTISKINRSNILLENHDCKREIRVLKVKKYPREWYQSGMGEFIGDFFDKSKQISGDFALHYGVHIPKQSSLKTTMEVKRTNSERVANSPISKWLPSLKKEAAEWGYVKERIEDGHRFVKTQTTVLIASEPHKIKMIEEQVKNIYSMQRWELMQEQCTHMLSFISCLPMVWGEGAIYDQMLFRQVKTTLSSEPVKLLPLQGEWYGGSKPGLLLSCRRGQLFFWDPFDKLEGNFNIFVCGKPGSGKSVFIQEIIMSNLSRRGRAFVIDVGRSYQRMNQLLDGTFIEFNPKISICVNPFSSIPVDNPEETQDALGMLKSILVLMAKPTEGATDLERALIAEAIKKAWDNKKNEATIDDIAYFLSISEEPEAKKLNKMLFPYTKEGEYGRYFFGKSNIDLKDQFVVLELEELKAREDLQAVILQIIILEITNQIYMGDRKTKTFVVLDEAWDMLRGDQAGLFIETAARRLRKYNGALITGTHALSDCNANRGSRAAYDNSDWTILLKQKDSALSKIKEEKMLELTPYMEKSLKSIETSKGEYSEFVLIGSEGFVVGVFRADKYSLMLYTTAADEYEEIENLKKQGFSLADAVAQVAAIKEKQC